MKILRKTHFWQDKRTYLELDAEPPTTNERGYPEEGSVNVRIGDEDGIKAAFKLSVDEARAVVDTTRLFLEKHDTQMARISTSREEEPTQKIEPASFSMFDEKPTEEKPKLQFYY